MRATVEALNARRAESERSTRHGHDFEAEVGELIQRDAQSHGDVFEATGNTTGLKPHCKKGDHVVELSPDSVAAGARVVFEAKDRQGFDTKKARAEIREARENRGAQLGVFIFSRGAAPNGLPPLVRYGNDLLVIWDRDDATTDVVLTAVISVARSLGRSGARRSKRDRCQEHGSRLHGDRQSDRANRSRRRNLRRNLEDGDNRREQRPQDSRKSGKVSAQHPKGGRKPPRSHGRVEGTGPVSRVEGKRVRAKVRGGGSQSLTDVVCKV